MNYKITKDEYFLHEGAFNVGFHAARIFSQRGEIAHNPYEVNTLYWYSFNDGANRYLSSLPDMIVG